MSGGVRFSLGSASWPRGVYRWDRAADGWRDIAPLPHVHARIVTRDGTGTRSGTSYLLSASGEQGDAQVIAAELVHDGSWAARLGVPLSSDPKVRQAAGSAIIEAAHFAGVPEAEQVPREVSGRIARPPRMPNGYLTASPLPPEQALEHWRAIAEQATPTVADYLGASAISPHVRGLGEPSHIIDVFGDAEQGKTTAVRIAAGVWGDSREFAGTLIAWNATGTGWTRFLGQLGTLPGFIDESGMARRTPAEWAQIIYQVCGGAQRLAGDRRDPLSTSTSMPWHGIVLMTGNGAITAGLGAGATAGVIRRVLESPGPFTADAANAEQLAAHAALAYGHPGVMLLERYGLADAAAALELARGWRGEGLAPRPLGASPGTTWARCLACHIAGAIMLDDLLGTGGAIADGDAWWPGLLTIKAADYAEQWLAEHDRPAEHDADALIAEAREAIAREPSRWPTRAQYAAALEVPDYSPAAHSASSAIPRHGIAREFAGVLDNDGAWFAMFGATLTALIDALGIDRERALGELDRRGVLAIADSQRRHGNKRTTPVHIAPGVKPKMYRLEVPPTEPDDQAEDDAEQSLAREQTPEPGEPGEPARSEGKSHGEPPGEPRGNLGGTSGGNAAEAAPEQLAEAAEVLPLEPAAVAAALGGRQLTAPAPIAYGRRDAASILMARGHKVAMPYGPGGPACYLLDGAQVTPEQLEAAARAYEVPEQARPATAAVSAPEALPEVLPEVPADDDQADDDGHQGAGQADQLAEARAALHLDVACPRCEAPVSRPCRTSGGRHSPTVHAEREAASAAAAAADPPDDDQVEAGPLPEVPAGVIMCGPRPPTRGDLEQVARFAGQLAERAAGHRAEAEPGRARREADSRPYLVLGGDGRAYGPGGEVLKGAELPGSGLAEPRHVGDLAALAARLGTVRLWVPRPARELLGLPAEVPDLPPGEGWPHPFTEAADPAEWGMHPGDPRGLAGWMDLWAEPRPEGARSLGVGVPEWMSRTPALAELAPAGLARALDLVHQATTTQAGRGGVAYERSPGATYKHLVSQAAKWSRSGTPEAVAPPPPYARGRGRRGELRLRPPGGYVAPAAEVPAGWVLARLDVNQCFASAAQSTTFGLGEAEHVKAGRLGDEPGAHKVMVRGAREVGVHPSLMPWIPADGRRRDAIAWLDTLAARWLAERGVPLEVLESYIWPTSARVFDSASGRLGAAVTRYRAEGTPEHLAAAAVIKAMSNQYLGGWLASDFGGDRAPDDWHHRPDWWIRVRTQAEVRKQRNLLPALEAGALVVLAADQVDSVYVAAATAADLEQAPGAGRRPLLRDGRGGFKLEQLAEVTPDLARQLADPRGRPDARRVAIKAALAHAEGQSGTTQGE